MKKVRFLMLGLIFAVTASSLYDTVQTLAWSSVRPQIINGQDEKWPPIWPFIDPDDGGVN
jgi:hypothetical protein